MEETNKTLPAPVRHYLLYGLAGSPKTMALLLSGVNGAEWDARPDPERFTLREVIAHLADWDGVWLERIQRMATEDRPFLPSYDEGQWAIDHDYARLNPEEQLMQYIARRERLVTYLTDLENAAWYRIGLRDEMGQITVLELAALVLGHDGYHIQQVIDYRGLGENARL